MTSDQFAGVSPDEVSDPRPWCELIRQWSTFHPEFNWLPRKFKIAVTGADRDRAAIQVHDIGIRLFKKDDELRFEILAGGGLGRTPVLATTIREDLEASHLLTYLEAILRVYNRYGRRDNKYKARIKILVRAMSPEIFAEKVEEEWASLKDGPGTITEAEIARVSGFFSSPNYDSIADTLPTINQLADSSSAYGSWLAQNVSSHKQPGYCIVTLAIKGTGHAPGDVTDEQLELIAELADRYSFGEVRVTHEQNVTLADVPQHKLKTLWNELQQARLASPNLGLLTDIICCPGGDYCSLANAKSIPVANAIQREFSELKELRDIGPLDVNISGCMNACGHHHVGNIGILGVDKKGEEFYQVSIGGSGYEDASLGKILGPSFARSEIPHVIRKIADLHISERKNDENFIDTYRRIGIEPYKKVVYANE